MVGTKRKYALHMKDGSPTIEGLLVKRAQRHFVLINAEILQDRDSTQELGGRVEIPRENVYCLQEIK
jgi:hypothetical protein